MTQQPGWPEDPRRGPQYPPQPPRDLPDDHPYYRPYAEAGQSSPPFVGYPNYNPLYYPGHYDPAAPYGFDARTGLPFSDKSKVVAGLLQLLLPFVGICGVGRLYAGDVGVGLTQMLGFFLGVLLIIVLVGLVIVPIFFMWTVIDGIAMLAGAPRDGQGRPLRP